VIPVVQQVKKGFYFSRETDLYVLGLPTEIVPAITLDCSPEQQCANTAAFRESSHSHAESPNSGDRVRRRISRSSQFNIDPGSRCCAATLTIS
jgi:hypothetical protein